MESVWRCWRASDRLARTERWRAKEERKRARAVLSHRALRAELARPASETLGPNVIDCFLCARAAWIVRSLAHVTGPSARRPTLASQGCECVSGPEGARSLPFSLTLWQPSLLARKLQATTTSHHDRWVARVGVAPRAAPEPTMGRRAHAEQPPPWRPNRRPRPAPSHKHEGDTLERKANQPAGCEPAGSPW